MEFVDWIEQIKRKYNIICYVGKTASMSMLTLFESRYTLIVHEPGAEISLFGTISRD